MCHRRFLDDDHILRSAKELFDGTKEHRPAPIPLSGEENLELTANMDTTFGKDPTKKKPANPRRRGRNEAPLTWKQKSIWFKLPYWKSLLLRHNFDVMHIEKNVCDNIVNTFLNIDGKSKDSLNAHLDVRNLGIREDLHPIDVDDRFYMPPAQYSMSRDEKKLFCQVLKDVRLPDGVASNIHNNVCFRNEIDWTKEPQQPRFVATITTTCYTKDITNTSNCSTNSCEQFLQENILIYYLSK
jgi:hypothetical protein